jgi:hypothetical protein
MVALRTPRVKQYPGVLPPYRRAVPRAFWNLAWLGCVDKRRKRRRTMDRKPFDSSVCIRIGPQSTMREVKSASGACECLIDWPQAKRGGSAYREAVESCNAVMSGNGTVEAARTAFIRAAEESGMLVTEKTMR